LLDASESENIAGLLAETRAALARLRADELEALAARAEEMLFIFSDLTSQSSRDINSAPSRIARHSAALFQEHRLLGDLLQATGENLRVLRRSRASGSEGSMRWVR